MSEVHYGVKMRVCAAKLYHLIKRAELIFLAHRLKPEAYVGIPHRLNDVRKRIARKIHSLVARDL